MNEFILFPLLWKLYTILHLSLEKVLIDCRFKISPEDPAISVFV